MIASFGCTMDIGWNRSPAHRDRDRIAPKAGLAVVGAVDGFVGPGDRGGGERGGVNVVGGGVEGEEDKPFAVVAVDVDFA